VPSKDEHWAPDHLVLARHVLAHAGRLFVERDASGAVLTHSPLAGMAAVEQRYPPWALGPFGRVEPEYALPESPGVFAVASHGVVHYVGAAGDLARLFGMQKGLGHISRRDCRSSRGEERCRLNRLITAEAVAGRPVDLYLLAMPARWSWRLGTSAGAPSRVAAEILAANRGDWHLPE
jgi:hypothetical protein